MPTKVLETTPSSVKNSKPAEIASVDLMSESPKKEEPMVVEKPVSPIKEVVVVKEEPPAPVVEKAVEPEVVLDLEPLRIDVSQFE